MELFRKGRELQKIFIGMLSAVSVFLFLLFILSVFRSGYSYQFDVDELFYAQRTFLFSHGYRPYLDVYTLTYSPLFEKIMEPVFRIVGYTFAGIFAARGAMIVLLIIRLSALFLFAKNIFNTKTAVLFIPLTLLDPFLVLTGMQYRPDNLMLLVFSLGLLFLSLAWKKQSKHLYTVSGMFFAFSFLLLPKMVPSGTMVIVISLLFLFFQKKFTSAGFFLTGVITPALVWGFILLLNGQLQAAFQQTFVDTRLLYSHFTNPIPIYFFNNPNNLWIFGTFGKPISWLYTWVLPFLGSAGCYQVLTHIVRSKKNPMQSIQLGLALGLPLQWGSLFTLQTVFIQHYLPVNWILALFSAFAVTEFLEEIKTHTWIYRGLLCCFSGLLLFMIIRSTEYNNARSTITSKDMITSYEKVWKQIPENEVVFPGYLFRKQLYPVPYGSPLANFPEEVFYRLPDMTTILEQKKPRVFVDEYTLSHFLPKDQAYIQNHYQRVVGDDQLMILKETE